MVLVNPELVNMGVTGFGLAARMVRKRTIEQLTQAFYLKVGGTSTSQVARSSNLRALSRLVRSHCIARYAMSTRACDLARAREEEGGRGGWRDRRFLPRHATRVQLGFVPR